MKLHKIPAFDMNTSGGRCFLKHTGKRPTEEYVVRTGMDDGGGRSVDLTVAAIEELARFIGWLPPDELQGLKDDYVEAVESVGQLQDRIARAKRYLDTGRDSEPLDVRDRGQALQFNGRERVPSWS